MSEKIQAIFRQATAADLPALIAMLSDDALGDQREDSSLPLGDSYLQAFDHIERDPNNQLIIMELSGEIVGMLQITFIPYLTYKGAWRCLIEGVRVASNHRGRGLGTRLLAWAIDLAKRKHCRIVQLTSDKTRTDAIGFYEALGFKASHQGFKLHLID